LQYHSDGPRAGRVWQGRRVKDTCRVANKLFDVVQLGSILSVLIMSWGQCFLVSRRNLRAKKSQATFYNILLIRLKVWSRILNAILSVLLEYYF
jgi:undecaprenyl pyrophosphate phosphatase UppP